MSPAERRRQVWELLRLEVVTTAPKIFSAEWAPKLREIAPRNIDFSQRAYPR
jgi:hypothetical protein